MPLQIRRGTTAEVNGITPLIGELVYDTQIKRVLVGDGSTSGGVPVAGITTNEAKDAAAASLLSGTHQNITFTYNSTTKALSAKVDILVHDTIEADAVNTAAIKDGSTIVLDVTNAFLTGDVKGSIFADDSTLLVDAVDGKFYGDITGNVTGNLTGNVTGNLTGIVNTNLINSTDSSTVLVDNNLRTSSNMTVDNDLLVFGNSIFENESRFRSDTETRRVLSIEQSHESPFATGLTLIRSRGTPGIPTIVQSEDSLGDIDWSAYTPSGTYRTATIKGIAEGSISGAAVPGRLDFFTADASGTMTRRMYLDSSGLIYLDGSTRITINGYAAGPVLLAQQFHATADARNITIRRGRGIDTAPTSVQNGDEISEITFVAHDGTGYVTSSEITHTVDDTVSTGIVPSRIDISVTDETGSRTNKLSIKGRKIELLAMPVLPTFADESAANAAVTTPINGMMYYDTGAGKIKGYQSGSWVILQP